MEYDIKKGWYKNIEGEHLEQMMKDVFGNAKMENGMLLSSYGILDRIEVMIVGKDKLSIKTVNRMNTDMDDDAILDSKRKLNLFVEKATGFNTRARIKRSQQKIKKQDP